MARAAAHELAAFARERGIHETSILPRMDEWEVFPRVAAATAPCAQEQGVARTTRSRDGLIADASDRIRSARRALELLMAEGLIAEPPPA